MKKNTQKKPLKKKPVPVEVRNTTELVQQPSGCITLLKKTNNILIAHKSQQQLDEYRKIFYSLFAIFCVLFLLLLLGLWYVKHYYQQQLIQLDASYHEQIKEIEFLSELKFDEAKLQFYLDTVDLDLDTSVTKYVDPKVSFNNLGYIPADLVAVGGEFVKDSKGGYITIHNLAKKNLDLLAEQFYNETQQQIVVVSGYRSYSYQKGIKDRGCSDRLCAKAGHSEHQSGYAVDLYSASTQADWLSNNTLKKYYDWLSANAHVYGYTNTYQKGVAIDGYEPEPWHWRYVGVRLATHLKQNSLTFAEYYYQRK